MEQRIQLIGLGVRDMDATRRFYVEGLGWEPALDLGGIVFIQVGHGLLLGLMPEEALVADVGTQPVSPKGGGFTMAHNVDSEGEVDAMIARAEQAGAAVLKDPQRAVWGGYHAYFADPDGFWWEVAYNPGLTVGSDGAVVIAPIGD